MDPEFDTEDGGEELSVEQAANAFLKSQDKGTEDGHPEAGEIEEELEEADDDLQESDEDESEDDGDPDEEGQSEEEDEDEPETEGGRFVASDGRVRLPDGSIATVSELIQGNLRDRDYRQKTMGLADEKRQFEEQSRAFEASMKQVDEQREYLTQLFESIMPQPPDPAMADPRNPDYDIVGYTEQNARYQHFLQHMNYLQQQQTHSQQERDTATQQDRTKKAGEEWVALQEAMPELKDQAKAHKFVQSIATTAQSYGFSPEEVQQQLPYDHRMVLVLDKAAKWDRLQANKPKAKEKVQGRPPVQKSGKRMSPKAQKARFAQDAMTRLKETGSVEDATRAYLATKG